jgi:hypothetical protein
MNIGQGVFTDTCGALVLPNHILLSNQSKQRATIYFMRGLSDVTVNASDYRA